MDIKTFVSETIIQIIEGANQANEKLSSPDSSGTLVCPDYAIFQGDRYLNEKIRNKQAPVVDMINFDIAVSVAEGKGNTGGVGVSIANISLGTKRTSETESSAISRVQFGIPILYPKRRLGEQEK